MKSLITKIMLIPVGILLVVAVASLVLLIPFLEDGLITQRKTALQYLTEVAIDVLAAYETQASTGSLGIAAAQSVAAEVVRQLDYGDDGYFWIQTDETPSPRMIMHPTSPHLEGALLDNESFERAFYSLAVGVEERTTYRNSDKNLFVAMAELVQEAGAGFVGYEWPKPTADGGQTEELFDKESYVNGFEAWGWAIGTGLYVDDIQVLTGRVRWAILAGIAVLTVVVLIVSFISARLISNPLKQATAQLLSVAEGGADLTARLPVRSQDEVGQLAKGFNGFAGGLATLVTDIRSSAEQLTQVGSNLAAATEETSAAIHEIVASISEVQKQIGRQNGTVSAASNSLEEVRQAVVNLSNRVEEQSSSVEESSAAVEEMVANVRSVTERLERNGEGFERLVEASRHGKAQISAVMTRIDSIVERSEGLLETNRAIESISSQTNLLAMNAAIEAAHAGNQGRGFAVVANEIRKLSEESAKQSKTTSEVLGSIKQEIDSVTGAVGDAQSAFEDVASRIEEIAQLELEIRGAMEEQSAGSTQVLSALERMKEITSELHERTGTVRQSREQIGQEMEQLVGISAQVEGSITEMNNGSEEINRAVVELADISEQNKENIRQIVDKLATFKTE